MEIQRLDACFNIVSKTWKSYTITIHTFEDEILNYSIVSSFGVGMLPHSMYRLDKNDILVIYVQLRFYFNFLCFKSFIFFLYVLKSYYFNIFLLESLTNRVWHVILEILI